jgi:hypothetical protein
MTHAVEVAPTARPFRFLLRAALLVWAGFWSWFVIAVTFGEEPAPPAWIPLAWFAALGALVALCWKRPTLGGLALTLASVWAAISFAHPGARALLAAPAFVLGLGFIALGRSLCARG